MGAVGVVMLLLTFEKYLYCHQNISVMRKTNTIINYYGILVRFCKRGRNGDMKGAFDEIVEQQ